MFLEKLNISKKESTILAIGTLIFIVAFIVLVITMGNGMKDEPTDLKFMNHQFSVDETTVTIASPYDEPFQLDINDENYPDLEILSEKINDAYDSMLSVLRNILVILYIIFFLVIIWNKKDTYFQGIVKGALIGAAVLLVLFTIKSAMDVNSILIGFDHHLSHMVFP